MCGPDHQGVGSLVSHCGHFGASRELENHRRVLSRGLLWSGLCFKRITWAATWRIVL